MVNYFTHQENERNQNAKFSITPKVNQSKLNVVYVIELDQRIP
jgi:hypothetical protein